jgi:lysophospholipase L1-like esterase
LIGVRRSVFAVLLALSSAPVRGDAPAAVHPTRIFIASDSTAQDYGPEKYPQEGWGTMLRCALDPGVTVENRAIAARSARSFINEGRLDEIARDIRAGDTLLIQFGHNDANAAKPERYASVPDYKNYLRRYIATAAHAGARAVLLTPVTRRNWSGGHVLPSFATYSEAVRELARETGTPLIDLERLSGRWAEAAGVEGSRALFLPDDTHFTELGARGVADLVAAALAKLKLPVAAHVRRERPALHLREPAGGASCDTATPAARAFRFIGRANAGETMVAPARAYAGGYGFEPGASNLFSVALPEGVYRVTITLGDARSAGSTIVEAESRRLMLPAVTTAPGESRTRSFLVDVRTPALAPPPQNAPGGNAVRLNPREQGSYDWDGKLTIGWHGRAPRVAAIVVAPVRAPRLFLFGDSTVTDQRFAPNRSWGQMLTAFVGADVAVANHAESGETLKSFLAELRLDKALSSMRPGDFALIQFGHNDQKFQWSQTYAAAATTYRAWLRAYIAEVRLHGGTPVLVTPPERRNFTPDGTIRPTLADYADAMRAVAAEEKVQLIDLNAASIRIYEALGPARAVSAFADGGRDTTHHDDYGAWLMAQAVAQGMRTAGGGLAAMVAPDLPAFDASHPIMPDEYAKIEEQQ